MSFSNTTTRILSSLVLITITVISFILGTKALTALLTLVGVLIIDEILVNFFKRSRKSASYIVTELCFVLPFVYFSHFMVRQDIFDVFQYLALTLNVILLVFLFLSDVKSSIISKLDNKTPVVFSLLILLPMTAISLLFNFYEKWQELLLVALCVNFGMDTGAWFFGVRFGKHKLCKKVSPNKTVEGLIGGAFTAMLAGNLVWFLIFDEVKPIMVVMIMLLAISSQFGDLIQSKFKRQVAVKDSSQLIPGHGGVYDRVDGLLFMIPFYTLVLRYIEL